jgi:uncharacterized protein with PQ loop repeat
MPCLCSLASSPPTCFCCRNKNLRGDQGSAQRDRLWWRISSAKDTTSQTWKGSCFWQRRRVRKTTSTKVVSYELFVWSLVALFICLVYAMKVGHVYEWCKWVKLIPHCQKLLSSNCRLNQVIFVDLYVFVIWFSPKFYTVHNLCHNQSHGRT